MARKAYTPEQIINKLREAEVLLSRGATAGEADSVTFSQVGSRIEKIRVMCYSDRYRTCTRRITC